MVELRITAAVCAAILWALVSGPLLAQSTGPLIRLTSTAGPASETEESVVALEGSAAAAAGLTNIHWVNQFEQRGSVSWSPHAQTTSWAADIPLRPGVNLLTVTAVDAENRSACVHLVVNRKAHAGALPQLRKIGTGTWQNRPIAYEFWNGRRVVEGDILLDGSGAPESNGPRPAGAKGTLPDGMGVSYTSQLWPLVSGVHRVPYVRTDNDTTLTTAITDFNAKFGGIIQFVPRAGEANYVNITVQAGGSGEGHSEVGVSTVPPNTLDCGSGCTEATWLHEMGHTVGLLHEHQRPDRASYITVNLANADLPNVPGNFTLFPFDNQTLGLYDHASVMHYGAFGFSKAGLPVLESIPAGIPLSNNTGYSDGDVDQIKRLYGAAPSQVTVTTNPAGLSIIVDGTTYPAPHTFSFALHSTHTLNLPPDPQNTSPADGSSYGFGAWNDRRARSHTITIAPGSGTLTAPANVPGVTVYEANFIRYQPFAFMSPAAYPGGSGTVHSAPAAKLIFGGSYYVNRTLVKLQVTKNAGYGFFDWFNLPFPPSDNPKSFYIQAPLTQAQAVLVATTGTNASPITLVSETLTGPNTWNPGLAAAVDGIFAFLPTAFTPFYNGAGWNGGTKHMIAVEQTQSPVTTNVYYNFNAWSDGGKISHTVTQPLTGGRGVSASFTPFYASYTAPINSCAGSVATSPPGVSYPLNPAFLFYEDATQVIATATPGSGMAFVGWSGSLSGTTNPTAPTPINDQFVPVGNFNLASSSAPLAITSFVPALSPARALPLKLTINGTGFTTSTFTDWNGNPRTTTYLSPTQLTVQLLAGDLANPGGQDVLIGNTTGVCAVYAEASFTVK